MKKIFRYIILAILALVVAIGAGYGIISKMQQQEVALSERAMLNLEALARGESPGNCERPPFGSFCASVPGSAITVDCLITRTSTSIITFVCLGIGGTCYAGEVARTTCLVNRTVIGESDRRALDFC